MSIRLILKILKEGRAFRGRRHRSTFVEVALKGQLFLVEMIPTHEVPMEAPTVRNTVRDESHNVTYHIMAYRKLTRDEAFLTVRQYLAQPKVRRRKSRERDKVITIVTIHGATAGI
jgi:hypothetical protein